MLGIGSETVARVECGRWGFWSTRRLFSLMSGELVGFVRSMWVGDPTRRHNSSWLLDIVDRTSLEGFFDVSYVLWKNFLSDPLRS